MTWVRISPSDTINLDQAICTRMIGERLYIYFNDAHREYVDLAYREAIWRHTGAMQCRGGSGSLSMTCPHCGKRSWALGFHININENIPLTCSHCTEPIYLQVHGRMPQEDSPEQSTS